MTVRIPLKSGADLEGFRAAVRRLIAARVPPAEAVWESGAGDLFGETAPIDAPPVALPRALAGLIEAVVCHRDP